MEAATPENKLATAGNWLTATKWKGHLSSSEDFARLKVKAQKLVDAVDITISGKVGNQIDSGCL
jgi:hypothetical protein